MSSFRYQGLSRPGLPRDARLNFHGPGGGVELVIFVGALIDGLELAEQNVGLEAEVARQHRADFGDARPDDRLAPQPVALIARPLGFIPGLDSGGGGVAVQHEILAERLVAVAEGFGGGRFRGGGGGGQGRGQ